MVFSSEIFVNNYKSCNYNYLMNTVLSLLNSFSITEYYSEKYKHSDISNNKNEQKDNGLYNDDLYNDDLYNDDLYNDDLYNDDLYNDDLYNDDLYNLKKPTIAIKKQYEIHGDKVLINAHYYTFWIPITEFNKYNFHNK